MIKASRQEWLQEMGGLGSVNTILENRGRPDRSPGQLVAEAISARGGLISAIIFKMGLISVISPKKNCSGEDRTLNLLMYGVTVRRAFPC